MLYLVFSHLHQHSTVVGDELLQDIVRSFRRVPLSFGLADDAVMVGEDHQQQGVGCEGAEIASRPPSAVRKPNPPGSASPRSRSAVRRSCPPAAPPCRRTQRRCRSLVPAAPPTV